MFVGNDVFVVFILMFVVKEMCLLLKNGLVKKYFK